MWKLCFIPCIISVMTREHRISVELGVAQLVKNLPAMQETQETWVLFLDREDPLAKEMATHFRIVAWRISWTEEPGRLQDMGW